MKRAYLGLSSSHQPMAIDCTKEYSPAVYERLFGALSTERAKRRIYPFIKRFLDIVFSLVLLVLFSPLMLLIAFILAFESPANILFCQRRIGKDGREFVCYKFRTMTSDAPPSCPTCDFPDRERYITPIGRVLRRYSLDELPQLFCVLLGTMSLVGYRPLVKEDAVCHELRETLGVYRVRPGITGYAQLAGRDTVFDKNKALLDAYYVGNLSLSFDVRLLLKTLGIALSGRGNADAEEGGSVK